MPKKDIVCEDSYDDLKNNTEFKNLIKQLEAEEKQFIIGIDLPAKGFNDYKAITYFSFKEIGGDLIVEGQKIIQ